MPFKITTKSGQYKIWMRMLYRDSVTSEKKLLSMIQQGIDDYKTKPGFEAYAESLQKKLDDKDIHEIASLWGIFGKSIRLS